MVHYALYDARMAAVLSRAGAVRRMTVPRAAPAGAAAPPGAAYLSPVTSDPAAPQHARDTAGRLVSSAVFPACWPDHHVSRVALDPSEQARVVRVSTSECVSARAVVCLHGWGASAYAYRHVLAPLAAAGVDAYAPDLRGHGWSDKPLDRAAYTPDAFAAWTLRLLDALQLDRALLVGHSLGGAIALHTAGRAPDRVTALVLLAPLGLGTVARIGQLRWLTPDGIDAWLPRLAAPRVVTALALRTAYGRLGRPTDRDVDEYWAPTADPAFARATRLVAHADPWAAFAPDVLAGVPHTVEVVAGARDNLLRVDALRRLTGALPHGALDVVPDAGHVLADEVPDRVLAAIRRALAASAHA